MRRLAFMMHAIIACGVCLSVLSGCDNRPAAVHKTEAQQQIAQQLRRDKTGE